MNKMKECRLSANGAIIHTGTRTKKSKDMKSDTLYRITGINKLTRLREPISLPLSRIKCEEIMQRTLSVRSSLRPFIYLKVEAYQPDMFSKVR